MKTKHLLITCCFSVLIGIHNLACAQADKVYDLQKPVVSVPFEIENGSIVLTVTLNNSHQPLHLLFDTGADGMALKQGMVDTLGLQVTRKQSTSVIGGNMDISISENNTVHLDTIAVGGQSIAIFKTLKHGVDGIIGNNIARRFIVKVDFDTKRLSLYNFDNYKYEAGGTAVPFTRAKGVIIFPGTLYLTAGKIDTGRFVFDSGASYGLICFRPFVRKNRLLVSGFIPESSASTTSMGVTTPTFTGKAVSFTVSNLTPINNLPVTLMAGSGQDETWQPGFDGSIGIKFISRYNFTINMQQSEIYFKPVSKANQLN